VHLERELKFRIESIAAARRLQRALPLASPPRRLQVHSIYYDTPDLRLQRAGAALRLRRAGRRWLQTLKAPQGAQSALAARAEWEMAVPRRRLDCTLFPREEVRASTGLDMLRLAPRLRPMFTTRFERKAAPLALGHGVRAEACIDRGTIEAGRSREPLLELELELLAGELGPLIGLAETLAPLGLRVERASKAERGYRLAGSAKPEPPAKWQRPPIAEDAAASDAFVALCGAALAQIAANAPGVARGDDPEYLHQLRVGMRRLLSVIRAFRPLLRRKRADALLRTLRDMMRVLGAARDGDVFRETLVHAEASGQLAARARHKRTAARRVVRALVNSAAFQNVQLRALRWLHGDPWRSDSARAEPLMRFARRSLERTHARLLKRARRIDWRDAERRHAVRIAVKRLRYGCDFFAGCFPHQAVLPFLHRLAALQDTLGELNDVSVGRVLVSELAPRQALPALREEAARVRQWLARRERELIASLAKDWSALERRRPYWRPKPRRRARR
jgi:triphosphatase